MLHLGSLGGDLSEAARMIHLASVQFDVTVWTNNDVEILFDKAERTPDIAPDYVAGTYGIGAVATDIENDLCELRKQRISNSMIFDQEHTS